MRWHFLIKCNILIELLHHVINDDMISGFLEVIASEKDSDVKKEESLEKTMKNRGRVCLFDENGGTRIDSHISKEK